MTSLANPFTIDEIGKYVLDTKDDPASVQPDRAQTPYIVVHHAAATYSPGTACASIFKAHCDRPDFGNYNRIGYHEVIQLERDATLRCHLVNPASMQGAGVFGRNDVCYHICAATNFTAIPDDIWIEALGQRVAAALDRFPNAKIVGHKDIALKGHETTCPGQLWGAWKLKLLGRVGAIRQAPKMRTFRALGIPIFQAQSCTGTIADYLESGDVFKVDKVYRDGSAHLEDERGFIRLDLNALEEIQ